MVPLSLLRHMPPLNDGNCRQGTRCLTHLISMCFNWVKNNSPTTKIFKMNPRTRLTVVKLLQTAIIGGISHSRCQWLAWRIWWNALASQSCSAIEIFSHDVGWYTDIIFPKITYFIISPSQGFAWKSFNITHNGLKLIFRHYSWSFIHYDPFGHPYPSDMSAVDISNAQEDKQTCHKSTVSPTDDLISHPYGISDVFILYGRLTNSSVWQRYADVCYTIPIT